MTRSSTDIEGHGGYTAAVEVPVSEILLKIDVITGFLLLLLMF